jgi:hypothetical protein
MQTQRFLLVTASLLVAVAACAHAPAGDSGNSPNEARGQSKEIVSQPSAKTGESSREILIQHAEQAYPPESYAGITANGSALLIHRVPVERVREFDETLRRQHSELQLSFVDALHARAALNEVAASVKNDLAYWRSRGVIVTAVSARADGSGVMIMVDSITANLTSAMHERYEFIDLEVIQGQIAPA